MTELEVIKLLLPRLLVATLCGIIVGWEREMKNKVAGIRTHVLVCVGTCIFTSISTILATHNVDPTRIIGQIVTGIGFLGAGVIFKHDDKVVGVTSAAFIWFIASMGVMVGIGYMISSFVITVGLLIVSMLLLFIERKIKKL